jgi:hypothetical protein
MASSLVNNKYRITRRIGGGSFGEIYMGIGPNNEKVRFKGNRDRRQVCRINTPEFHQNVSCH